MSVLFNAQELVAATNALFVKSGLAAPIAAAVAEILVDADLLGYNTHGLQFVPAYLSAIEAGKTRLDGVPEIVHDSGGSLVLDADRLPGQWVMLQALELATARLAKHPLMSVVVRRSSNISCLATYVKRAADDGYIALLMASAPGNAVVAPHGGRRGLLSTNPFAFSIPTEGDPILADSSTSSTSNRAIERAIRQEAELPVGRLVDAAGRPSTDPNAIYTDPPGAILPVGGLDQGYKGFMLSILVEALTSGLSGFGRVEGDGIGNNVFLLLINPEGFSGADSLRQEMQQLAVASRSNPPREGISAVRMPGDRAHSVYRQQCQNGVALQRDIIALLTPCFARYGVAMPDEII